jgi:hypothetical protein
VKTFLGEQEAYINPIRKCENGIYSVSATFISKGENALSLCHSYIKEGDDVREMAAAFHASVLHWLSQSYSVKIMSK